MKLTNLTVKYGRKTLLDNVNFTLTNRGHIVGILGQNGAGKTTLINVLLQKINKFTGEREVSESISYLPDKFFLYESMTVGQAIKLFAQAFPDFDEQRAERILAHFGLEHSMKLHSGSKGNHEQVHLALVLARNVDFYVMDEPLSAIDPLNRQVFIKAIENFRRKNSTVIIVTHLLRDLGEMFDDVVFMKNGQIIAMDSQAELLEKYQNLETAYAEVVGR
ncbi:ABC transporter ATP-binding protein [Lactobacillus sp. ESL0791]|uniref:ABC transporter ATP-binding protein n=1 Tax=Lactobacillus sp. ESL0791 TaxID=2983234 RepID=UPI0023F93969|nr:ABC transporter ATP-binding protein [Lactobacillus sp. ESL0791]MDF7638553.1 ABC transporter ATP-binding protein [Lactobacillus sp. ESL0791]